MSRQRRAPVRGKTLFVTTMVVLMSSEFAGIGISGLVYGRFTPRQAVGLAVVESGALFVWMGQSSARRIVGTLLLAIAGWGAWHLARVPHGISVHAVLLTTQTSLRLFGALILLASRAVADYTEQLSQPHKKRRRKPKPRKR